MRAEATQRAWLTLMGVWGESVGYQGDRNARIPFRRVAATEPLPAVFGAVSILAPSLAALNTLVVPVAYRSLILIDALLARPWRPTRHIAWSSSSQIEGTKATRGPRRLKQRACDGARGHEEHPAAAPRRQTLTYQTSNNNSSSVIICLPPTSRWKVNSPIYFFAVL